MTSTQDPASRSTSLQLPFERESVLNVSPTYAHLREQEPVVRVITPANDPAWLVVAHQEAKTVFSDPRFGYYVHDDPEHASRMTDAALHAAPMGGVDFEAESIRLRRLMAPGFTPKRTRLLEGWIQELTDGCLDDMQAAHDHDPAQPVDFHDLLGYKLPVLVICALLGVPEAQRDYVLSLSDRMGAYGTGMDPFVAMGELQEHMRGVIEAKRGNLGEDVISDMIRADDADPDFFSTLPIEHYAGSLVFPGHETTVARMDFGLLYLLFDPSRRDWLMEDPDGRIGQTVEEIVRLTSAYNLGLMRYAVEDVELGGVTIRKGDLVIISEGAANRDPKVFQNPEAFDPTRDAKGHLAFGHGMHICIGQSLARAELRIVFPSLFRRFPGLNLAVDPSKLRIRTDRTGGGVGHVPVTW
jgi:cytochrome P450